MVSNATSVGGFRKLTGPDVLLDDGVFEVTLIKTPKNPIELNDIVCFLTGISKDSNQVYSFQTNFLKLTSSEDVSWTLDGEYGGNHHLVAISNCKQEMEIIVE